MAFRASMYTGCVGAYIERGIYRRNYKMKYKVTDSWYWDKSKCVLAHTHDPVSYESAINLDKPRLLEGIKSVKTFSVAPYKWVDIKRIISDDNMCQDGIFRIDIDSYEMSISGNSMSSFSLVIDIESDYKAHGYWDIKFCRKYLNNKVLIGIYDTRDTIKFIVIRSDKALYAITNNVSYEQIEEDIQDMLVKNRVR